MFCNNGFPSFPALTLAHLAFHVLLLQKQEIAEQKKKKTLTYFRLLFHLCKSRCKPLKLHFSMNDKCNYLSCHKNVSLLNVNI